MSEQFECFSLTRKKSRRRAGTAVLIFPGLVPAYEDLGEETKMFSRFGDVFSFHYPETKMDIFEFYNSVTEAVRSLKYKKIILVGVSFGGTLAYLLLRYWRKTRFRSGTKCLVALSTPFEPTNLTPYSQFQLDLGTTLDRYARKLFIVAVKVLRWFWQRSFGLMTVYAKDNTFQQTLNALWMGGNTLNHDWLVKRKFTNISAVLLNVKDGVSDRFVLRTNEGDFLDMFPDGRVLRVLRAHADIRRMAPAVYRQVEHYIEASLRG